MECRSSELSAETARTRGAPEGRDVVCPRGTVLAAAVLLLLLAAAPARGQVRMGVMGLRAGPGVALPPGVAQAAGAPLWHGAAGVPGLVPVPEPGVAAVLGAAGAGALAGCAADACMAQFAAAAGLDRVLYAVALPFGSGFTLHVRCLSLRPFVLLGAAAPTCGPCTAADLPGLLASIDVRSLVDRGLSRPPVPPAPAPPAPAPPAPAPPPPAPAPPPATGGLTVTTEPPGAQVVHAGRVWGVTPLDLPEIPPGTYALALVLPGHTAGDAKALVVAGDTAKVHVVLHPPKGEVSVTSKPSRASVLLESKSLGKTPLKSHALPAGEHVLVVRKKGYFDATVRADVEGGVRVEVSALLRARPTAKTLLGNGAAGPFVIGMAIKDAKRQARRRGWRWTTGREDIGEGMEALVAWAKDRKKRAVLKLSVSDSGQVDWLAAYAPAFVTEDGLGPGLPLSVVLAQRSEGVECSVFNDDIGPVVNLREGWATLTLPAAEAESLLEDTRDDSGRRPCERFAEAGATLDEINVLPAPAQREALEEAEARHREAEKARRERECGGAQGRLRELLAAATARADERAEKAWADLVGRASGLSTAAERMAGDARRDFSRRWAECGSCLRKNGSSASRGALAAARGLSRLAGLARRIRSSAEMVARFSGAARVCGSIAIRAAKPSPDAVCDNLDDYPWNSWVHAACQACNRLTESVREAAYGLEPGTSVQDLNDGTAAAASELVRIVDGEVFADATLKAAQRRSLAAKTRELARASVAAYGASALAEAVGKAREDGLGEGSAEPLARVLGVLRVVGGKGVKLLVKVIDARNRACEGDTVAGWEGKVDGAEASLREAREGTNCEDEDCGDEDEEDEEDEDGPSMSGEAWWLASSYALVGLIAGLRVHRPDSWESEEQAAKKQAKLAGALRKLNARLKGVPFEIPTAVRLEIRPRRTPTGRGRRKLAAALKAARSQRQAQHLARLGARHWATVRMLEHELEACDRCWREGKGAEVHFALATPGGPEAHASPPHVLKVREWSEREEGLEMADPPKMAVRIVLETASADDAARFEEHGEWWVRGRIAGIYYWTEGEGREAVIVRLRETGETTPWE